MDVDNKSDYKEMVRNIHNTVSDPSLATKISIDMKHIEKLSLHQMNGHSRDKESSVLDNDQVFCLSTIVCTISNETPKNIDLPPKSASNLDSCLA